MWLEILGAVVGGSGFAALVGVLTRPTRLRVPVVLLLLFPLLLAIAEVLVARVLGHEAVLSATDWAELPFAYGLSSAGAATIAALAAGLAVVRQARVRDRPETGIERFFFCHLTLTDFIAAAARPGFGFAMRMVFVILPGSLTLVLFFDSIARSFGVVESGIDFDGRWFIIMLIGAGFVAPVLETLIMWPILAVLVKWFPGRASAALASGLVWGVLHVVGNRTISGLQASWPFFIFSLVLLAHWETSRRRAFFATSLTHSLVNLVLMALLAPVELGLPG